MEKKPVLLYWVGGLTSLLLVSIILTIIIGSVSLPIRTVFNILLDHVTPLNIEKNWTLGQEAIVWNLRLPRVLLAIIIGGMLTISGVAFQGILRNPLADPYILGVSSGAALGAAISILLKVGKWLTFTISTPLFAFAGSMISLGFVMWLSNLRHQRKNETLILAGVVVQSLIGALLTFAIALSGDQMQMIIFWMMGSLANKDMIDVAILFPYFLIGFIFFLSQYRVLNVLTLGEKAAIHLGVDVERKKIIILMVASLLTATAVSIVGIIGFVGLVVPHMLRILVGPDHRILIPTSTIAGAIFLLWTDTMARTMIPSREIPIGVVTALIGAPFFAYLLRKGMGRVK